VLNGECSQFFTPLPPSHNVINNNVMFIHKSTLNSSNNGLGSSDEEPDETGSNNSNNNNNHSNNHSNNHRNNKSGVRVIYLSKPSRSVMALCEYNQDEGLWEVVKLVGEDSKILIQNSLFESSEKEDDVEQADESLDAKASAFNVLRNLEKHFFDMMKSDSHNHLQSNNPIINPKKRSHESLQQYPDNNIKHFKQSNPISVRSDHLK